MAIVVAKVGPTTKDAEVVDYPALGEGDAWFVVEPSASGKARFASVGPASAAECKEDTLMNLLQAAAKRKGDKDALAVERVNGVPPALVGAEETVPPALPYPQWTKWTYKQYHEDVRAIAKGFMSFGFPQYGTVNVWGFNAPEWYISAFAGMFAGGKVGGIYPTDTPEVVAYKIVHSSGNVVTVDDRSKAEKIQKALNERKDCRHLKAIISWGEAPQEGETLNVEGCGDVPFISWAKLKEMGAQVSDAELDERIQTVQPQKCAVLVYTSGTTGDPKAVMLSHDNMVFASQNLCNMAGASTGLFKGHTRVMSYLPLSHVAGCVNDMAVTLSGTAKKDGFVTSFFARVYDIKKSTIAQRMVAIKPSAFFAVPLVYEKIADRVKAVGASLSGLAAQISATGKDINLQYARNIQLGKDGAAGCCKCLGDRIGARVRANVGFDECKFFVAGAAPIRVDTLEYYSSLGIYINEAYGMSESTAAATMGTDQAHIWGSCGYELLGCQTKVFKVDEKDINVKTECPKSPDITDLDEKWQGEICFRGRHVMMGYLACPDMGETHKAKLIEKTAETIDTEGWLHSGDKGLKTIQNMIKITGRFKELIIGAGGENIAPVPIEDNVKKLVPAINECMMIGDQQKYNIALITLKAVGANGELPGGDELDPVAKLAVPGVTSISQAMHDEKFIKLIQDAIAATNKEQKIVLNNTFQIQKFTILPSNFSELHGELTPTKKLKRKVVEKIYSETISKIYATDASVKYFPYA